MSGARRGALHRSLLFVLAAAAAAAAVPAPSREAAVFFVTLDQPIQPITARYFEESLRRAEDEGAALLVLKLETPGGLVTSMESMIKGITGSRVPVVVFVTGTGAASAGFFLTIAADVAVMAPGTTIGAAHPVASLGEIPKESTMNEKVESHYAALARSLAANRGRNAQAAEQAVRASRSFTEKEALQQGLIDFIATSETGLLDRLDGMAIRRFDGRRETLRLDRVRLIRIEMSGRERFLSGLAHPTLAAFLLLAGVVLLYLEFTHPGLIAPGLIGGVCLLLFALSSQILPINWIGVALMVLGIVMFLLEIKIASYGLLTAGGVACLVIGALLLYHPSEGGIPEVRVATWAIVSIAGSAGLIMAILTSLVVRAYRRRPSTGTSGLIHEEGEALTDLAPEGRVFVHGEYWNARARGAIRKGARVRVVEVRDLRLEVEEIP
ncbi:MAG: NfeD family protein [Candidatus Polarisedimenticolia bacterium]